jgi:hypothetical protein
MGYWRRPSPTCSCSFFLIRRAAVSLHFSSIRFGAMRWRMLPWHSQALLTMYPSCTTPTSQSSRAMRVAVGPPALRALSVVNHARGGAGGRWGGGGDWGGLRWPVHGHAYTRHPPVPRALAGTAPHARGGGTGFAGPRCWRELATHGGTSRWNKAGPGAPSTSSTRERHRCVRECPLVNALPPAGARAPACREAAACAPAGSTAGRYRRARGRSSVAPPGGR